MRAGRVIVASAKCAINTFCFVSKNEELGKKLTFNPRTKYARARARSHSSQNVRAHNLQKNKKKARCEKFKWLIFVNFLFIRFALASLFVFNFFVVYLTFHSVGFDCAFTLRNNNNIIIYVYVKRAIATRIKKKKKKKRSSLSKARNASVGQGAWPALTQT